MAQGAHASGPQLFKKRRLRFDDRHQRSDDVDHAAAEIEIGLGPAMRCVLEADAHGVAALANGLGKFIREVGH
jgi:hypothetical protein